MKTIAPAKYTAVILTGILIGVLSAEVFLHFFPAYSFNSMCTIENVYHDDYWSREFRPSSVTGYELIPRSTRHVNSFGMRDKEYSLQKPEGTFRIVLLGDSITENGTWSGIVEHKLKGGGKYEILNCGTSGWGLYNYLADFKNRGMKFNPDLVLVGFCLNDVSGWGNVVTILVDRAADKTTLLKVNGRNRSDITRTLGSNPFLIRYSYLYRFLLALRTRFENKVPEADREETGPSKILAELKEISKGRIMGIIFPYLKPLRQYNADESWEYKVTREELQKAGIRYLDLTDCFNAYGDKITDFRLKPEDKIHFNDEANKIKAAVIYEWLKKQNI